MDLQERRRLNDEIERAYIDTAYYYRLFLRYDDTERGITPLDLYEKFFDAFSLLVVLTSDLSQLREVQDKVKLALEWIERKVPVDDDAKLLSRIKSGAIVFKDYKKILNEQGIVALPSR